ncbi:hypothetical protein ACFV4G_34805 [Kitasatospora sp. NPDC059747]|uniref:hypothetical protein n=1 Tax=Kitasatospora sp. NPDC059747 TaxID=3346930 RepID=UPI00365C2012
MTMETWRGFTNGVLYAAQFGVLDRAAAERVAGMIVRGRQLGDEEVAVRYEQLGDALAGGSLITGAIPQPHGEQDVREFLALLRDALDRMRPWPQRPFRTLDTDEWWPSFRVARPLLRLHLDEPAGQARLGIAQTVTEGGAELDVLVLRLASGERVAVAWTAECGVVLDLEEAPREHVAAAFLAATGLTPDEVSPLGPEASWDGTGSSFGP